jgi:FkbM family methyltransferase
VGAHSGEDTSFYLNKGFRVVAIEANPRRVKTLKSRFKNEISERRLFIVGKGIHEEEGSLDFYLHDHDDWSSFNKGSRFVEENSEKVIVPTVKFSSILAKYGVPYYLKADIEGSEFHVFSCFPNLRQLPTYLSFELTSDRRPLDVLRECGYNRFKLVDQKKKIDTPLPNPPLEGVYFFATFGGLTSGPFGEEAMGSWVDYDGYVAEIDRVKANWANYQSWFDVHLTRSSSA